jgi:hypothetical protein
MRTAPPLDVKVVYSAAKRRRASGKPRPAGAPSRSSRLILLAVLNLVVAGALYYGIWWRVDKFIYLRLMMHTPLLGVDIDATSGFLVPNPAGAPESPPAATDEVGPLPTSGFAPETTQVVMVATSYGWLTLATFATCVLAFSAGTLFGWRGGQAWRRAGLVLAGIALLVLIGAAFASWSKYGAEYPPAHLRAGMGGLGLIITLIGVAVGRGRRGWLRGAAGATILAGVGTALAVYLGTLCDAIKPDELPVSLIPFLFVVFAVHSLWGWILLPIASRIGR